MLSVLVGRASTESVFWFKKRLPDIEGRGSCIAFLVLVPEKQNKVTEEGGNILKVNFLFSFLMLHKNSRCLSEITAI